MIAASTLATLMKLVSYVIFGLCGCHLRIWLLQVVALAMHAAIQAEWGRECTSLAYFTIDVSQASSSEQETRVLN